MNNSQKSQVSESSVTADLGLVDPIVRRRILPNGTYAWTALDYNRATNVLMDELKLEQCRHEQLWCDLRLAIREVLERPLSAPKGAHEDAEQRHLLAETAEA
jgi:hypothetical protein